MQADSVLEKLIMQLELAITIHYHPKILF